MRLAGTISRFAWLLLLALAACNAHEMQQLGAAVAASGVRTAATPSCAEFSEFDLYADCQSRTGANCLSEWHTFSTGGSALCYYPPAGSEGCRGASIDWIYTPYTVLCYNSSLGNYTMGRSVVVCPSSVCACTNPQVVLSTCTGGSCPTPLPNPMPTCP